MSGDYSAFQLSTGLEPRYKSTALVRATLTDPVTRALAANPSGTFTLWQNGTKIIDAQAMSPDPEAGASYLLYVIPHTAHAARGDYKWEVVLTDPATGYVGTDEGRYKL